MTPAASPAEVRRSALFFALTLASVTLFSIEGVLLGRPLSASLAFSVALLAILLAHEMGHYVVARIHGFALSLPVFVPFPAGFGTLGAIIRLRSPPRSRQALLEMGLAGPLAGAVVAFAILLVTLPWTEEAAALPPGQTVLIFNDPLILRVVGVLTMGEAPGRYAMLHPAAVAAWVGCLVTGINLLPIGQLDGGHAFNAVFPRAARALSVVGAVALLVGGFWWSGWFVWGALLLLLGAGRPLPVAEEPPLPLRSRVVAALGLLLFVLTFMPVPMEIETTPGTPESGDEGAAEPDPADLSAPAP